MMINNVLFNHKTFCGNEALMGDGFVLIVECLLSQQRDGPKRLALLCNLTGD